MSLRPRRALLGLVATGAALAAVPAAAQAAETITVTPSNLQAGGNPTITSVLRFAPGAGDTPKTVVLASAPGILANLNANPACLTGAPQLTPSCLIGTATVSYTVSGAPQTPANGSVYVVPPQNSGDFAGIETVAPPPVPNQYTGASLRTTPTVGVNLTTTFPDSTPTATAITGFTTALNPTLNGQPFTHLPSSCNTATSTLSVTYYGATPNGSASGSFTPTGCASLPYAPNVTASITKDAKDSGAALIFGVTQPANESANKSIALTFPSGLTANVAADIPCLGGTGCNVGTATASSPLVPSAALANGTVTLAGSAFAPAITIAFPAPFGITITGSLSLTSNAVTFASVPDIPLTSLTLNITGPNGQKAFNTDCTPANIGGTFTAQSGATHTVTAAIKFAGCATKPTASGSTSGLASGNPKLKFKLTRAKGGANISAVAIGLPGGLKFFHSAFVTHKTCTTKGQKKCVTTTMIRGLGISGAKAKSVALKAGKLVITLKKGSSSVTITASGPLVTETKALQTKVKKHKVKTLVFTFKFTDAKGTTTTVTRALKPH